MISILRLEEIRGAHPALVGGKGANLGELVASGFPVPPGFVVTTHAYEAAIETLGITAQLDRLDQAPRTELARHCSELQQRLSESATPAPLAEQILEAHRQLMARGAAAFACAVRSSATAEDLAGASFAGQHGTYYYVTEARLLEVIRRCWASLWGVEAAMYRATRGIPHSSVRMAVIVQEMVESDVSGVAFTANPVSGSRDDIVVEASWGMGAALVDGRVTPDRFLVSRTTLEVRERRVAAKQYMVPSRISRERDARIERVSLSLQSRQTLDDVQAREVAELALQCERHFGTPQDVEWAVADGRMHLLQSRPITTLRRQTDGAVKGKWVLFKALAENFTDPMTPLTQDLVGNPGIPGVRFIGGRIYMNLDLARPLVPFDLTDEDLASLLYLTDPVSGGTPRLALLKLPTALAALTVNHLVFGVVMARTRGMPDDFMTGYRALCRRVAADARCNPPDAIRPLLLEPPLLAPIGHMPLIVNLCSMRFMPWMATLKFMLHRWAPGLRGDAVALLCSGTEGVLSARMGRDLAALAQVARSIPAARDLIARHEPEEALERIRGEPSAGHFLGALEQFLCMHGHRAVREFELASPRWSENPAPVIAMVRNYVTAEGDSAGHDHRAADARREVTDEVARALERRPLERILGLRRRLIELAARRARYYLKLRENSRFYHIMGFGVVRKKILAVETELLRAGKLKCRDDIFSLHWPEVNALRAGRLAWRDVEDRVRERRLEHVRLAKATPPKTIGIAPSAAAPVSASTEPDVLRGSGASPGRYEGVARVILDPSLDATLRPGEVLVAPYTDPAWTPLFLTAGAAVVEIGSYLSHAGTVAREYGMPCVVDVTDCTQRIPTGARLEVDGDLGTVRLLDGEDVAGGRA